MSAIALTQEQREEKTYSTMSASSSTSSMTTQTETPVNPKDSSKKADNWDGRTKFVVYGQGFLFLVVWMVSLGHLVFGRFWNRKFNQQAIQTIIESDETPEGFVQWVKYFPQTYYFKRYVVFFPHVVGAILWWNLYFLQLIPSIRRKHRRFHRILGRVLMVTALAQTLSGVALAKTPTFKLVSYFLATAVVYCVYNAWYFASIKDIPKHKYWAMRLVGYLHAIALQRVFMWILFGAYMTNSLGLYPPYDETDGDTLIQAFDHSWVCGNLAAILLTEWYLAGYYGWTETEKK